MRPNEAMEFMTQQMQFLFEQNRMLVMLIAIVATGLVVMMSAIAAFLVGWKLRQDKEIARLREDNASNKQDLRHCMYFLNETIPELYRKWDAIICGQYPNKISEVVETVKNALLGKVPKMEKEEEKQS